MRKSDWVAVVLMAAIVCGTMWGLNRVAERRDAQITCTTDLECCEAWGDCEWEQTPEGHWRLSSPY